ncbi:MAG: 16S rRNA (guanine(527)-N(7))-methyltransferase RsmG [Rhodospirillales bacterium]|nr:16S rRNA (guanine(527)-N(7))-methyltransferase RsmG [Rhodospirillales bacterium]MDP6883467.1 16S rRNA (guanine(527)-N(7))-methyltransferase RsmG [Rhodospirillales bacterium]
MKQAPLTARALSDEHGLAPAAVERLEVLVDLLVRWQRRINLVSRASLADPWRRHVLDSAQLHAHLPPAARTLIDLGSGAGFPGLVLAILGGPRVHLVESNQRKCAFLGEANRLTEAGAVIHHARIESLDGLRADVVTARACARLDRLLALAQPLVKTHARCLFLKGRTVEEELTESQKIWTMAASRIKSASHPSGVILIVEDISRRDGNR